MVAGAPEFLHWKWVAAFVTLARCGSQVAAAEHLGCSQPTVGNSVRRIEAWLGESLGSGHSPYVLSDAGRRFLKLSKKIYQRLRRLSIQEDAKIEEFNFEWAHLLYALEKCGSQNSVSASIYYSQTSASRKLKKFEAWLGYYVFERDGSGNLTEEGRKCFESVNSALWRFLDLKFSLEREAEERERLHAEWRRWDAPAK